MDSVIPYSCRDISLYSFPGATPNEAPPPLLANWGPINANGYRADMTVCILLRIDSQANLVIDVVFVQCQGENCRRRFHSI